MHMTDHPPEARLRHHRHDTIRSTLIGLLLAGGAAGCALAAGPAATATPAKPVAGSAAVAANPAKSKPKPNNKPASPRQQLQREAEGLALATTTVETITEAQLNVAMRVLTGAADCEFNERVSVTAVDGQPGHFHVGHKGLRYTMVPEETATGAVRLVDRRAGVMWLQIPVKSMLMNSKQGRRLVDACTHAEQRAAVAAVQGAAAGIGIAPTVPTAAATAAAAAFAPAASTPAVVMPTGDMPAREASPAANPASAAASSTS